MVQYGVSHRPDLMLPHADIDRQEHFVEPVRLDGAPLRPRRLPRPVPRQIDDDEVAVPRLVHEPLQGRHDVVPGRQHGAMPERIREVIGENADDLFTEAAPPLPRRSPGLRWRVRLPH
jgi:hypothetical protein